MNEKNFKSWSRFRKLGKKNYTLLWILYFILLLNVLIGVGKLIEGKQVFDIQNIIIDTVFGIIGGTVTGKSSWNNFETKYQNYIDQKK